MTREAEFLSALFEHVPPGHIEARLIEDKKGGKVIARTWYASAARLIEKLAAMARYAEGRKAGVFVGVLPRASATAGTSANVLPGLAVWADLDFDGYLSGEPEARERLSRLPFQPTLIVRTGHGLHVYFVLREPEAPDVLSRLSARLAYAVGGDHVHDPARILRVPGTMNMKDPAHPVRVEIESWEPSRRYNPSELMEALPEPPKETTPDPDTEEELPPDIVILETLTERVKNLIDTNARVRNLFVGQGKPETDENGRVLDTTSSGYDLSFVMSLVRHGVRDFSELGNALWHRADDAARTKGLRYIARTVRRALELVPERKKAKKAEEFQPNFTVERVCAFDSNPPQIVLEIGGGKVILTVSELLSVGRFRTRFVEVLRWVPRLPRDPDTWEEIVNGWLAQAEVIPQPPEASPEELVKAEIQRLVDDVAIGESVADLDRGLVLLHEDVRLFKLSPLLRRVRQEFSDVTSPVLSRQLRELGYAPRTVRRDDGSARVWGRVGGSGNPEANSSNKDSGSAGDEE